MKISLAKNSSLVRFLISGGIVFCADISVFGLLVYLDYGTALANAFGMLTGFLLGYVLHAKFSFRVKTMRSLNQQLRYLITFLFNLGVASVLISTLAETLSNPWIAKLIAIAVVVLSNYLISRYFVFQVGKTKH